MHTSTIYWVIDLFIYQFDLKLYKWTKVIIHTLLAVAQWQDLVTQINNKLTVQEQNIAISLLQCQSSHYSPMSFSWHFISRRTKVEPPMVINFGWLWIRFITVLIISMCYKFIVWKSKRILYRNKSRIFWIFKKMIKHIPSIIRCEISSNSKNIFCSALFFYIGNVSEVHDCPAWSRQASK